MPTESKVKSSTAKKKAKEGGQTSIAWSWCSIFTVFVVVSLLTLMGYAVREQRTVIDRKSLMKSDVPEPLTKRIVLPSKNPTPQSITYTPTKRKKPISAADSVYWGHSEFTNIKGFTSLRMDKHRNRFIVFSNITVDLPARSDEPSTGIYGQPKELVRANDILIKHPLHQYSHSGKEIEDVMYYVKNSEYCKKQPIYLSMATVQDDLYWQLIENFVYTMVKFGVSDCSLVICVSDPKCMKMCEEAHFPCYYYEEKMLPMPSVMEQIARLKLLHVPKALAKGVDVFMLDLDVGFLEDPNYLVKAFYDNSMIDMLAQEDVTYIMNRTVAGWKQWWTEPLPNIGLFLCRGNEKTAKVFEIAWDKYSKITDPIKKGMPGKDQNHVLEAIRIGKWSFGLHFAYFDNFTAPLLDKLIKNYGTVMELGGDHTGQFLHKSKSIAMHTTCYEKSTKVMGLKATNSFWNPRYYDPLRPTITKQLLYIDEKQLLDEVRSLVWLAMSTKRSLIIPNILGDETQTKVTPYKSQLMWPGFRVLFLKKKDGKNVLSVEVLEPAYYWRVERDYDPVPEPHVLYFDPESASLMDIKDDIERQSNNPRIILHSLSKIKQRPTASDIEAYRSKMIKIQAELVKWSSDSVGLFSQPYSDIIGSYQRIPSVKEIRQDRLGSEVLQSMRNCARIFDPFKGNRSCFQICK